MKIKVGRCYIYNDIWYPQLSIFHFQFSTFYVYNAVAKCAAFAPLGQFSTFNFLRLDKSFKGAYNSSIKKR